MTNVIEYIEIDTPAWQVTSPMGPDVTWRFTQPVEGAPKNIDAIPSLKSVALTPAVISLGEDLGMRASLTITLADHKHIFADEPFDQGTFWGKWRGRFGQRLRGRAVRWKRGVVGQALDDFETWHFIVDSVNGPTPDGTYTITAQDVLKQVDDDRSLAPRPSNGTLLADIDADDTAFTLGPVGVGDLEYPASGYVAIGGKEICQFTRVGDVMTITRSITVPGTMFETEVDSHQAGDRVQLCLIYIGQDPANIIYDLFTAYADIDADLIDLNAWQAETSTFLQTLYTTIICEPTGVNTLVSEIVSQAGLAIWWDAIEQTLRLQVLRAVSTTAGIFNEDKFLKGSLKTQDQPDKRISEVLMYYGLREPLKPIDQEDNYRAALLTTDPTAANEYNGIVNRTIQSRWIPFGGQQVAERISLILLGRYRDPPRKINFDTWRFAADVPQLGGGYQLGWTENQNADGTAALAPIQVTSLNASPEKYSVEAQEALFTTLEGSTPGGLNDRTIIIPANINNVNLRTMHDSIYPQVTDEDVSASPPVTLTCIINANVIVGSASVANPAFNVGNWPTGFQITLRVVGRIQGHGGNGGGDLISLGGFPGGPALLTRFPVALEGTGQIWGGGGGGGAGLNILGIIFGGGGGAGQLPGAGGTGTSGATNGSPGTTEAGGAGLSAVGITSGAGGGPGLAGVSGTGAGGAAGAAIDGVSHITGGGSLDKRGGQIN